jgi:hypothetical protein
VITPGFPHTHYGEQTTPTQTRRCVQHALAGRDATTTNHAMWLPRDGKIAVKVIGTAGARLQSFIVQ